MDVVSGVPLRLGLGARAEGRLTLASGTTEMKEMTNLAVAGQWTASAVNIKGERGISHGDTSSSQSGNRSHEQ